MKELDYPFDREYIVRKRKRLLKELAEEARITIPVKIAVLGGATTVEIINCLELFLKNAGFEPVFYESEFGRYYEEAVFGNKVLDEFNPDIVLFHTCWRNLIYMPDSYEKEKDIEEYIEKDFSRLQKCWNLMYEKYNAIIIQNNYERAGADYYGSQSIADSCGGQHYISEINRRMYLYKNSNKSFYINDIEGLSSQIGLSKWQDERQWVLYKNSVPTEYIPDYAFQVSEIIKAIYGVKKKLLILDADNTLWGGVIGDVGTEGIDISEDSPRGQSFRQWQRYLKGLNSKGVLLAIVSKNNTGVVRQGLSKEDSILHEDDFVDIIDNWEDKAKNILRVLDKLNLGAKQTVFVDDSKTEREWVKKSIPEITVVDAATPEEYLLNVMQGRYFDYLDITEEDKRKTASYIEEKNRKDAQKEAADYNEYLRSLGMKAKLDCYKSANYERIVQLINKTNQFNPTTLRLNYEDIKRIDEDENYIAIAGSLKDRFGEYGIVSVLIGECLDECLHIRLFVLSCRAFSRQMEDAMMLETIRRAKKEGCKRIIGYYYPTEKNIKVKGLYESFGFEKASEEQGIWEADVDRVYCDAEMVEVEE